MADERIYMTAILTPTPGKEDRLEEVLLKQAEHVRKNEPGTLRFQVQRGTERGGTETRFVVWEVYKDEASHKIHFESEALRNLMQTFQEEGLADGPKNVFRTSAKGGVTREA
ncbi:hypothetical protein SBRCBS47491_004258 [Sporothrix bragantina]|uniref:ABM domain-containing protein n=1 Tax=Sporothrix bragantina TaxID=671064 RepID=A0ABP0BLY7_9PEZI